MGTRSQPLVRRTYGRAEVFSRLELGPTPLHLGIHTSDRPRLALVRLAEPLTKDLTSVRSLVDEARLIAELDLPGIARVLEAGIDEGDVFLTTEFVGGCTLAELIKSLKAEGERLPIACSVQLAREIASTLHEAHRRANPVVHADLTLSSVMLSYEGLVKVIDFHVPRVRATPSGLPGVTHGTVGSLAPEQIRREPPDGRTDQFSLGVALFELVTGTRLFQGSTTDEILRETLLGERADAHVVNPEVPAALSEVIQRAVRRTPADRFGSMLEFARALEVAMPVAYPMSDAGSLVARLFKERRTTTELAVAQAPVDPLVRAGLLTGRTPMVDLPLESGTSPARPMAIGLGPTPIPAMEQRLGAEGRTMVVPEDEFDDEPKTRRVPAGGLEPMLSTMRKPEPLVDDSDDDEPKTRAVSTQGLVSAMRKPEPDDDDDDPMTREMSTLGLQPMLSSMRKPEPADDDEPMTREVSTLGLVAAMRQPEMPFDAPDLGDEPRTSQLAPAGLQALLSSGNLAPESRTTVDLARSDVPIAPKIAPVMSPPRPAPPSIPPAIPPTVVPPSRPSGILAVPPLPSAPKAENPFDADPGSFFRSLPPTPSASVPPPLPPPPTSRPSGIVAAPKPSVPPPSAPKAAENPFDTDPGSFFRGLPPAPVASAPVAPPSVPRSSPALGSPVASAPRSSPAHGVPAAQTGSPSPSAPARSSPALGVPAAPSVPSSRPSGILSANPLGVPAAPPSVPRSPALGSPSASAPRSSPALGVPAAPPSVPRSSPALGVPAAPTSSAPRSSPALGSPAAPPSVPRVSAAPAQAEPQSLDTEPRSFFGSLPPLPTDQPPSPLGQAPAPAPLPAIPDSVWAAPPPATSEASAADGGFALPMASSDSGFDRSMFGEPVAKPATAAPATQPDAFDPEPDAEPQLELEQPKPAPAPVPPGPVNMPMAYLERSAPGTPTNPLLVTAIALGLLVVLGLVLWALMA